MNHLAQVIYTRLQNQQIENPLVIADTLSEHEIAALHELESLLRLPVAHLAEIFAQTDQPEWALSVERPGLAKDEDMPI